jgi:hypothetical protein
MKTTLFSVLLMLALTSLFFISCEPIDETPPSDDPRDPYVGEWHLIESFKNTEAQSYIITIALDNDNSSQVIIGNLGNPGSQDITVRGIVTSGQLIVSSQTMTNKWIIEGSGMFSNVTKTTMDWTYSITAGGNKDDYNATATLQ